MNEQEYLEQDLNPTPYESPYEEFNNAMRSAMMIRMGLDPENQKDIDEFEESIHQLVKGSQNYFEKFLNKEEEEEENLLPAKPVSYTRLPVIYMDNSAVNKTIYNPKNTERLLSEVIPVKAGRWYDKKTNKKITTWVPTYLYTEKDLLPADYESKPEKKELCDDLLMDKFCEILLKFVNGEVDEKLRLNKFDSDVQNVVYTFYKTLKGKFESNECILITPRMIAQKVFNLPDGRTPTKLQITQVKESMVRCRCLRVNMDIEEQITNWNKKKITDDEILSAKYLDEPLIWWQPQMGISNNGMRITSYQIIAAPVVGRYSSAIHHMGTNEQVCISKKVRRNSQVVELNSYLIDRITQDDNEDYFKICYSDVYLKFIDKTLSKNTIKQKKSRLRDRIDKLLSEMKDAGTIVDFTREIRNSDVFEGVIICLTEEGKNSTEFISCKETYTYYLKRKSKK